MGTGDPEMMIGLRQPLQDWFGWSVKQPKDILGGSSKPRACWMRHETVRRETRS
jgi:hypothetical protein